ncbi:uncharacterized protein LOC117519728 [Thalassophryne amazonica]|uniref:uncharacterized protein LOC117519728 n=1 Tax=Thalassophryne amazonica TaxID=390379 RepID=UPI001470EC08|nr:uncharacterized protein LOC117519728 [Thalassophryne amazonica]
MLLPESAGANVQSLDQTSLLRASMSTYVPHYGVRGADDQPSSNQHDVNHSYSVTSTTKSIGLLIKNVAVYISGWFVKKAIAMLTCEACRLSLVACAPSIHYKEVFQLLTLKNLGKLKLPSDGVVRVLMSAERHLRQLSDIDRVNRSCSKLRLQYRVLEDVGTDALDLAEHAAETMCGVDNHYYELVCLLVTIYYDAQYHHVARLHTQRLQGMCVRQKYTKLILFKGQ